MIQASELIQIFRQALDEKWGYIWGMSHEKWTADKQAQYAREHAGDPDRENSIRYGGQWVGRWVTDCSGLFHYGFKELGGYIPHGSNSIWNSECSGRGELKQGERTDGKPLLPGTAVFTTSGEKHNHIGLYVGDGMVIEAQGAQAGVAASPVSKKKWTAWGELKGVRYQDQDEREKEKEKEKKEDRKMAKVALPTGAAGNTVNMREESSRKARIICKVPVGTEVDIISDVGDWCLIEYNGKGGWMMSNYLEYDGQDGESSDDTLRVPRDKLEEIYNQLGDWLGLRG